MKRSLLMGLLLTCCVMARGASAGQDHSEFFDEPFASGPEMTEACLDCHEEAAAEFMKTTHWTWDSLQKLPGHEEVIERGKATAINNFCIAIDSNWPRCTSCHAGYGWKDASFDFKDPTKVDCLVCHDGTGTYAKAPTKAGEPAPGVDLLAVARSVTLPRLQSCGSCHFFGGGGDHVKHGDLDSSLIGCNSDYDVHMATDGADLSCQGCHETQHHQIKGSAMVVSPAGGNRVECIDCHDAEPHESEPLNRHHRVACQTCHIPRFAKSLPTNVYWDWSTAGKNLPAKNDEYGLATFHKKKGSFVWKKNVEPTYRWYSGRGGAYSLGEVVDPDSVVQLNWPIGSKDDPAARIFPFNVHRGKQIYDPVNHIMIVPKLFGDGGFWNTYDWNEAARLGMKSAGLPYSGQFDFVQTEMFWPVNHMVVGGEQALKCLDCHGKNGHRLDWKALGYGDDPIRLWRARQRKERKGS